jgi:VWFA-related protein
MEGELRIPDAVPLVPAGLVAAGLLLGLAPAVVAQQEVFEDQLEVTEVLVAAVVTDRSGAPVEGLPREVLSAVFQASGARETGPLEEESAETPSSLAIPLESPAARYFMVLIQDLRRGDRETLGVQSQQVRAVQGLRKWVEEELGEGDFVAVLGFDSSLRVHQDLTTNRDAILAALDRLVTRRPPERSVASGEEPVSLLDGLAPDDRSLRDATPNLDAALRWVGRAAASVPGRKHLLLFSIGLGLKKGGQTTLDRKGQASTTQVLNDGDVSLDVFDLTPARAEHSLRGRLVEAAEATGGRYFQHLESFHKPLRELSLGLGGYYLLSYRTALPRRGTGYRRLEVGVVIPGYQVSARRGYVFGEAEAIQRASPQPR